MTKTSALIQLIINKIRTVKICKLQMVKIFQKKEKKLTGFPIKKVCRREIKVSIVEMCRDLKVNVAKICQVLILVRLRISKNSINSQFHNSDFPRFFNKVEQRIPMENRECIMVNFTCSNIYLTQIMPTTPAIRRVIKILL